MVRDTLAEWNRGDVDALVARATEDFEWHPALVQSVESRVFRGGDGFREFIEDWKATWDSWSLEAEEMSKIDNQVLVSTRVRAKAHGSGVEFDQPMAHLFEVRDGKISRGQTFFDRDEARGFAESRAEKGS